MTRALLLDFGGTLATERTSRARLYCDAAAHAGLDVEEARMTEAMRAAHDAVPHRSAEAGFRYSTRWFQAFIFHVFRSELSFAGELGALEDSLFATFQDAATFRVFPDAARLLRRAKEASVPVAIVSNWGERLPELTRDLGLEVDLVLASAALELEKPDPALFERALATLGAHPDRCLHVGDRHDTDVAGARAAGIECRLLVRDGEPGRERVSSLDEVGFGPGWQNANR